MKLRPTHKCFDDALDLLAHWVRTEPSVQSDPTVWLVHGLCTDSETKEPYAHAWVQRGGAVYQAALNEAGERVYLEIDLELFEKCFGVLEANCYSIRSAWEQNKLHGHFGPWTPEHLALTLNNNPAWQKKLAEAEGAR